jgi:DNA-binding transcriptional regulator YhcF (GntR family)
MNHEYVENVWETSPLRGSQLLVHIAMASDASSAGYCWSTTQHLAKTAHVSYMTVRHAIETLKKHDLVDIEEKFGHKEVFHLHKQAVPETE